VSEDEDERNKRRQGRNLREQQRSQKITQQIDHLREVLASANITFKPDKYSTLVTVAEYIKQLQAKSAALDAEHEKLLSTISKTNEIVNDRYLPASTTGENPPGGANLADANRNIIESSEAALVPNIDYRSVFKSCGVPLAVASIDGRFVDCNLEFLKVTGYSKEELLPCHLTSIPEEVPSAGMQQADANKNLSLFNLLHREHMEAVFLAMSEMLKRPPRNDGSKPFPGEDCWAGYVYLTRLPETKMRMNVTLVRGNQGGAKFFDCSLLPVPNG
jgi:PAS domain-containing protein